MRCIKINLKKNCKSYSKNNEQRVTRIEVESELYDFDVIYQDVTLDTQYSNWQKETLKKLFTDE